MAPDLDTLLEGSPAYGVLDARDGMVLFRRPGHEAAFNAMVVEVLQSSGDAYEAIPLAEDGAGCERLFVAPLS